MWRCRFRRTNGTSLFFNQYLNPGGSVKDRVALRSMFAIAFLNARLLLTVHREVIEDAECEGLLRPYTGSRIFEGTVGSTGISIATIARARCVGLIYFLVPMHAQPPTQC
jgi:cysteine synthase